jgi:hypothetical protein
MWQLDNLICDKFSVCDALLEDVAYSKQNRTKKKKVTPGFELGPSCLQFQCSKKFRVTPGFELRPSRLQ